MSLFDAAGAWRMSRDVSLRDEPFGALAYHHGNRRLVFLKSRDLVAIVRDLENHDSASLAVSAHVAPNEQSRYEQALSTLVSSEIICGR